MSMAIAFFRHGRVVVERAVNIGAFCSKNSCTTIARGISSTSGRKNLAAVAERRFQHPAAWDNFGIWLDGPVVLPPRSVDSSHNIKTNIPNAGCASQIGKRKENEDRYCIGKVSDSIYFFAVFDGHGGDAAAEFCSRNLSHFIMKNIQLDSDLESVLVKSFLQIDNAFLQSFYNSGEDVALCAGTTATVALLRNKTELVVASVGDSPAVLCREGKAEPLTEDHSPRRKDERQRIQQCGGFIDWNSAGEPYVNGRLAMTRSIGDLQVKPYGVTAEPEVTAVKLQHTKDSFLVLTTDGVSGFMEGQEMCDIVKKCQDPSEAALIVADQALQYGSQDNATTMVVPFGAWGKYKNALTSSSFGRIMVASGRWS
ncbi:protein phosphatase 1K, mitochondrial-like [Acipenser oxyrinchus oxyrinchus]|uniref:protein-serine/threonine phosphatase n=1 Tax=Acipenser oxyrinchus oxyrinchus TaxID=40147 RepID=A0AAD8D8P0_ACIOX|nr:protein phosphatase 1K, mitochondrial-like [Acipenser oxyrinchus oxyrinchus]